VGGNDDDATCQYDTLLSSVSFCSSLGATYDILVHGYGGAAGDFMLHIDDDGTGCTGAVWCGPVRGACCDPEGYCFDDVAAEDCLSTPGARFAGRETTCKSADADGDNVLDVCDECPIEPALVVPDELDVEVTCNDGIDNDCDGLSDMEDSDCRAECTNTCGDIDGDVDVDLRDYASFARCFGSSTTSSGACVCCDLNGDAAIDVGDFAIFFILLHEASGHTPPHCP